MKKTISTQDTTMAEGDSIIYKGFKDMLMKGIDLALEKDTFKVALHTPHHGSLRASLHDSFAHEAVTDTEVIYGEEGS